MMIEFEIRGRGVGVLEDFKFDKTYIYSLYLSMRYS